MDKIRISQLKAVFDEISHFITSDDGKGFGVFVPKETPHYLADIPLKT